MPRVTLDGSGPPRGRHAGVYLMRLAFSVAGVSASERLLLGAYGSLMDRGGGGVEVSQADLAAVTSLSVRTVRRAVRRLEARGFCVVTRPNERRRA
jgi:DNA-binding MarR family transcriptional regulator